MATYINLVNLTEQGIRTIKDSTKRAEAFRQMAARSGHVVAQFVIGGAIFLK